MFGELEHLKIKMRLIDEKFYFYYESIHRDLKIRPIYECRCDGRPKTKSEEFTQVTYTGLLGVPVGELEHRKIETRLIDKKFPNVMGEYVTSLRLS